MKRFVRAMELDDISQAAAIEREAFPPPWPPTNFKRDLTVNTLTRYLVAGEDRDRTIRPAIEPECSNSTTLASESRFGAIRAFIGRLFNGDHNRDVSSQLILGFAVIWFLADEAHLANIAVREAYRQQGIGEQLLISVVKLAMEQKSSFVTLEVRASNKAAQALYSKYGFKEVGVRNNYYSDNQEDAVLMTVDGITSASFRKEFHILTKAFTERSGGRMAV